MTITPGSECLYGARVEWDAKAKRERLVGGMLCSVISIDGDEARCQAIRTKDEFTVKLAKLRLNETEGS